MKSKTSFFNKTVFEKNIKLFWPLWKKILEGFKDPMIMILLVALVVQVVLFTQITWQQVLLLTV